MDFSRETLSAQANRVTFIAGSDPVILVFPPDTDIAEPVHYPLVRIPDKTDPVFLTHAKAAEFFRLSHDSLFGVVMTGKDTLRTVSCRQPR